MSSRNYLQRRVSTVFSSMENAEAFASDMHPGREPTIVPLFNAEDRARGYTHPRFEGVKVVYWLHPLLFYPNMKRP